MKILSFFINVCSSCILLSCSIEHIPTLPIIQYNSETSKLIIIQTDTTAHDTATISIKGFYEKKIPVKDTISISLNNIVKNFDQIKFAYKLAIQNNTQNFSVKTSRTSDTIFTYCYKSIEIAPINVATVVSGNCIGLYDVNYNRNYRDKIRLWIFKNNINPDSLLIENMNSLIKQFNYSGHNEYSKIAGNSPVFNTIKNTKYKFEVDISGRYFYLYVTQNSNNIISFIEKKISEGLKDAQPSSKNEFFCKQSGETGPNCLFMIGIDENWKYTIIPLGIVFIDNMAPVINISRYRHRNRFDLSRLYSGHSVSNISYSWPNKIYLSSQNVLVNLPQPQEPITSSVSVSYGNFEGNDYFGYNIPFYIDVSGDVQTVTIGTHKLDAKKLKTGECTRLRIKGLHTGDNSLPLSATDVRGNKSTSSLSISLVPIKDHSNYDDDYDDLDTRITDIESRLDDLE